MLSAASRPLFRAIRAHHRTIRAMSGLQTPPGDHSSSSAAASVHTNTHHQHHLHGPAPHRPRKILLVRHGESMGNCDESLFERLPDYKVPLSSVGRLQAFEAGPKLRAQCRASDRVVFYTSPYLRARETYDGIVTAFEDLETVRFEEPRLRELDWGNLQCVPEIQRIKELRKDYGHFFYRIPNGESGADCYDRVSSFLESMFRHFENPTRKPDVVVIITHGLLLRVFLMRFFRKTFEEFESWTNVQNGEIVCLDLNSEGRYVLDHPLDSWKVVEPTEGTGPLL